MKRAVVLSGGGSRGAYQIGVFKALKKLKIDYDIITGTSVGALNGALMVQGDFLKAKKLWQNLNFGTVFDKNEVKNLSNNKDIYKMYAKKILNGGGNPKELDKTLRELIDEKMVMNSKINYGLVTVKFPSFKPVTLTKKDIPKGKLIDYLMASATCFPAFQLKEIDNSKFIDGGYYDNLPINLAVSLGAEEIIAVDLKAIGNKRNYEDNLKVTYISPKNNLGSFLIFDSEIACKNIKYGYNDTLKVYKKLDGDKYSFFKNQLSFNYELYKDNYIMNANKMYQYSSNFKVFGKLLLNKKLKLIVDNKGNTLFNNSMEYLGTVFKLDDTKIYLTKTFNNKLLNELNKTQVLDLKLVENLVKSKRVKDLLQTKMLIKYMYNKLGDNLSDKGTIKLLTLAEIFPKEFLGALYLKSIKYRLI